MASLTQASHISRILIKWGIVSLIGLMVGRVIVGGLIAWYKATHPVVVPPTVGFGVIPPVVFPMQEELGLTYRLETISGGLPDLGFKADVMLMPSARPNLLALDRSIKDANALGFKVDPEKVSSSQYRFRLLTPLPMTLTMSIYDGLFEWETDWTVDPNFLVQKNLPEHLQATKESLDLIRKLGNPISDLTVEAAEVDYLRGLGGKFQPTPSLSDADFVRVNLFRSPHSELYPFVTPDPNQGIVQVILSGNPRAGRVVSVKYNYVPVDYVSVETYPLRTTDQAWQDLQDGKGYVAQIDKSVTDVIVRKVSLAYFDSFEAQPYMQPVYVFTGDNNFIAYVQAVKDPKPVEE